MIASATQAQDIRIATFTVELDRKGPGLLLRDIESGKDKQIQAVIAEIVKAKPDIIVLQRFDWDMGRLAVQAFQNKLKNKGWDLPHAFAPRPNSGAKLGSDLPKDGVQSFGRFPGNRGLVLLSRFPIQSDKIQNHSDVLWSQISNSQSPDTGSLAKNQKLPSVALVTVPILVHSTLVWVTTFHANAPLFDGGSGRNVKRNADEITFASQLVIKNPEPGIMVMNANLDPEDGKGSRNAIRSVLAQPRLIDTTPQSEGGVANADTNHNGNPAFDTVDWPDDDPGNLRVSYILPTREFTVKDAGVQWVPGQSNLASRHRLVWADISLP